jgi:hypothetical protein
VKRRRLINTETPNSEDAWLVELHSKLWNKKHLQQELFQTIEITAAHYKELQERLSKQFPNRHSPNYRPVGGVLSVKLDVLRNFKVPHPALGHVAHPTDSDDEKNEDENNDIDDELHSFFPATIKFLDLSSLRLRISPLRMPLPLLVRDEYNFLSDMLDKLPRDGSGSAIVSGQPGTGKISSFFLCRISPIHKARPLTFTFD